MERGATLSLGQRQLLSFARALLYDPAILILDEATSSVDSESEALIQQAIDKLISNRTSIVIAHRLSTIRKADKILVLDKGEIKEMGSHEELLEKKGVYYQLYRMQFADARPLTP
jgi:ATP-binding cassette subfamily B protein